MSRPPLWQAYLHPIICSFLLGPSESTGDSVSAACIIRPFVEVCLLANTEQRA